MSITMGKRTFNNAVSEMSHERLLHHQADFRRIKGNFNSNDSTFDLLHTNKQKNIVKLEQLFPNKTKNELIQLMEDFDDDMELLIDVLEKQKREGLSQMSNIDDTKMKSREIRNIKSLLPKKEFSINAKKNEMQFEEIGKKAKEDLINIIGKDEMNNNENLIRSLAEELVKKLQSSQNLNDAFSDVVSALKYFEDQVNTNSISKNQTINQENSLLKKAFYKQFKKTEDLQKNYQRVLLELEKNKEELKKSQNTNYSLSLLLKSLDCNQSEPYNHEIF